METDWGASDEQVGRMIAVLNKFDLMGLEPGSPDGPPVDEYAPEARSLDRLLREQGFLTRANVTEVWLAWFDHDLSTLDTATWTTLLSDLNALLEPVTNDDAVAAIRLQFREQKAYVLNDVSILDDALTLLFQIRGDDRSFAIQLPAPSSPTPQPWLYLPARNADDWVSMLRIWLDEEILTGASYWAATRLVDGIHHFSFEQYGFQRSDADEHERLIAQAQSGD